MREEQIDKKEGSNQAEKTDSRRRAAADRAAIDKEIARLLNSSAGSNESGAARNDRQNAYQKRIKKNRKRILFAAVLSLVLMVTVSRGLAGGNSNPIVQTSALAKGDIQNVISVTGPIEGTDSVDVTSNLHAKVIELNVKEGDRVKAGQTVLARLDTTDLQKELEIVQGRYDLAVATKEEERKNAQLSYEKAVQDLNTAQEDFNRKSALIQTGDIAQVEVNSAADVLNNARRAVAAFDVKDGKVEMDKSLVIQENNARLELEKMKTRMEEAVILAPISGIVTRVNTKVGQFADDLDVGQAMITIENLDALQMEIKISEYSIGSMQTGQSVKITADILGTDDFVPGEVVSISPTGEEKGDGSAERVIPTRIRILENAKLIAGITAKAEIILQERKNTYVVPISAVGQDADGGTVMQFVQTTSSNTGLGRIVTVPVKTGIESDLYVELLENPLEDLDNESVSQEQMQYLTSYDANLMDGMTVRAWNMAAASALPKSAASAEDPAKATASTAKPVAEEAVAK